MQILLLVSCISGCEFNSADISDLSMGAIVPEGADSVASISSFANATAATGNAGQQLLVAGLGALQQV